MADLAAFGSPFRCCEADDREVSAGQIGEGFEVSKGTLIADTDTDTDGVGFTSNLVRTRRRAGPVPSDGPAM
ncbi:hypothetical protein ACFVTC_02455 [Streptomyces sp. NPDC057950]|uniref:hypothetical protein n=1 Tax=Streptomyces sp. NPDC057950 TaxID=3346288 RepID=UPI0036EE6DE5